MYIVNTSFMVEPAVHGRWYDLFEHRFIPYLHSSGFGRAPYRIVFTRVLTDTGDSHHTYSLQVEVPDTGEYQRFMQEVMGEYATIAGPLFGEKVLHFTTLLKPIDLCPTTETTDTDEK